MLVDSAALLSADASSDVVASGETDGTGEAERSREGREGLAIVAVET